MSEPCIIEPNAVYTLGGAQEALGLAKGTLPREIRLGRLKAAKRAGKYMITGAWLLEWIEAGVVAPRRAGGDGAQLEHPATRNGIKGT
jgi:hypothetical protein